jgi:hypothetical protein
MYRVEDVPAQNIPAEEYGQLPEVVKDRADDKKRKQYVEMLVPDNGLFH